MKFELIDLISDAEDVGVVPASYKEDEVYLIVNRQNSEK